MSYTLATLIPRRLQKHQLSKTKLSLHPLYKLNKQIGRKTCFSCSAHLSLSSVIIAQISTVVNLDFIMSTQLPKHSKENLSEIDFLCYFVRHVGSHTRFLVVKPLVCQPAWRNLVPKLPRVLSFSLMVFPHGDEVREIPSILTFQKQKCYNGQNRKKRTL